MEAERWRKVESIFDRVLDAGEDGRDGVLSESCEGDEGLRREVESLLAQHEAAGELFETPAFAAAGRTTTSSAASAQPRRAEKAALAANALISHYRILRKIGSGGMGAVYEAEDLRLHRRVALKFLPEEFAENPQWMQRFRLEARAASALNHPNICTIYEVDEVEGRLLLAMELLEGQTLRETIDGKPLPLKTILDLGVQIAGAIDAAHCKGIVHRDIKPANIFVTKQGQVKILDFGIAKLTELYAHPDERGSTPGPRTQTGMVLGSVGYMSPEQVRCDAVDHRSDIFAFGAILYEMLTGRRAFQRSTQVETMAAILNDVPPAIYEAAPGTPLGLQRVVNRCLEKDPSRRFQSAADLAFALQALMESGASTAVGVQPNRRPGLRRPLTLTAIVGVFLIVAGFAVWKLRPTSPKPLPAMSPPLPLTTYRGNENYPSFSPDGNQVAFQWDGEKQDNVDIYVKALGPDATPLRLTTNPAPDRWPAWSPDGSTIAFQRSVAPNLMDLMLIPALGGPERKLAEFPAEFRPYALTPTWSQDSKWIIVPDRAGERTALFRVSVETGESIQITNPDPGIEDVFPAISPDGGSLLFTRNHQLYIEGDLYLARLDGDAKPVEAPHLVLPGNKQNRLAYPVWTADGNEIIATVQSAGVQTGVVRLPVDGSQPPTPIPWMMGVAHSLALSRRSNRLAYTIPSDDSNIWRIDLTAKTPRPEPVINSTARDVFPQYSPDGSRLAFYSQRSGLGQVWVSDAEGRQAQRITFVKQGQASTPHWSPDGHTLAIDSNQTGVSEIYTVSANGGAMKPLTEGPFVNFDAIWSRDGRWMYFTSKRTGRAEIWKMPDGGGPATQITHNGGMGAVESLDGKTLYYTKEAGSGSMWRMPSAGGPEEQFADSLYRTNFAVTGRGIYYMTRPGNSGTSELKFYNFATGKTTAILPIGLPEYGLDVSPDGRYLAYAQLDDAGSVLMLVENFH
jgi:serine/threonine protein kinase/sugar lactone lactonase YvrE